jgi:hypothetical protein
MFILFILTLLPSKSSAFVQITENGKAKAIIVIPDESNAVVLYAAQELQYHIQHASGVQLKIFPESKSSDYKGSIIYLGTTNAAARIGIDVKTLGESVGRLKTVGDHLFLAGYDMNYPDALWVAVPAGTLFAVYDFLDVEMGVRWLWPGELGEFIPMRTTLELKNKIDRIVSPRFEYILFRNTIEPHKFVSQKAYEKTLHDEKVWQRRHRVFQGHRWYWNRGHHFTDYWEKYNKTHPEWFAMNQDGNRILTGKPSTIPMCVSQQGLVEQVVRDWRDLCKKFPKAMVNACENDTGDFCRCEKCQTMDGPDPNSKSDRYAKFWLAVQKEAQTCNSDATVIGYAYWNYRMPPKETILNSNIIVGIVTAYLFNATQRADSKKMIEGWGGTGASLFLRPNHTLFGHCMPWCYPHSFAEEFKLAVENSAVGFDYDSLTSMWSVQGPRLYLMGRLITQSNRPVEDLLAEYYNGFGPAAPFVRQYFEYWEQILEERYDRWSTRYDMTEWNHFCRYLGGLYSFGDFNQAQRILNRAKAVAHDSPIALRRVEFLQKGLTNVILTYKTAVAYTQNKKDPQSMASHLKKLISFRKSIEMENVINPGLCYRWESTTWDYSVVKFSSKSMDDDRNDQ